MRLLSGLRRLLVVAVVVAVACAASTPVFCDDTTAGSPAAAVSDGAAAALQSAPVEADGSQGTSVATRAAETNTKPQQAAVAPAAIPAGPAGQLLASLHPKAELSAGERLLSQTKDDAYLNPMSWHATAYKARHELLVYYKGRLFRTYHAVFGRSPKGGTKLWEGDLRTPEGVYWIVKKYDSERWKRFLRLNYPNLVDRNRYGDLVEAGEVPLEGGRPRKLGGAIGIHGTDEPRFNRWNINWTAGCISVDNDAITELDRILPVGTFVIIKP